MRFFSIQQTSKSWYLCKYSSFQWNGSAWIFRGRLFVTEMVWFRTQRKLTENEWTNSAKRLIDIDVGWWKCARLDRLLDWKIGKKNHFGNLYRIQCPSQCIFHHNRCARQQKGEKCVYRTWTACEFWFFAISWHMPFPLSFVFFFVFTISSLINFYSRTVEILFFI